MTDIHEAQSSQSQENTQPIGGFENDISDAGWTECEAIEQPQVYATFGDGLYTWPRISIAGVISFVPGIAGKLVGDRVP